MQKSLQKILFEKYPKIFADKDKSPQETLICFGFECGDGWYWLIDHLCQEIQGYIDNNEHLNICQVVATQVKEKYAGLSFYYYGGDDRIEGMVQLAEHFSYYICEQCGTTENIGCTQGWYSTCCKRCYTKSKHLSAREWKSNTQEKKLLRDSKGRFSKHT